MRYAWMWLLLFLGGCGLAPSPQIQSVQTTRNAAIQNFASNTASLHTAEQEGYRAEGYAHVNDLATWDLEKVKQNADGIILDKANAQGVAPKAVTLTGAELQDFAAKSMAYVQQVDAAREANKAKVDAKVKAVRDLVAKAQTDLATALELQALLDQLQNSGVPAELISQATALISQILANNGKIQAVSPQLLTPNGR